MVTLSVTGATCTVLADWAVPQALSWLLERAAVAGVELAEGELERAEAAVYSVLEHRGRRELLLEPGLRLEIDWRGRA